MAAAKRSNTRTPFREAELSFLSRHPPPDYSQALDFRKPHEELLKDPKVKLVSLQKPLNEFCPLFGSEEDQGVGRSKYAFLHEDHPGTLIMDS